MKYKKKWLDTFYEVFMYNWDLKIIGCLYFSAYISIYVFLGFFAFGTDVVLEFWTIIQMFFAAWIVGQTQLILVKKDMSNSFTAFLWLLISVIVSLGFGIFFKWYDQFPKWCEYVYYAFFIIAAYFMWLVNRWENRRNTEQLNAYLKKFQEEIKGDENNDTSE